MAAERIGNMPSRPEQRRLTVSRRRFLAGTGAALTLAASGAPVFSRSRTFADTPYMAPGDIPLDTRPLDDIFDEIDNNRYSDLTEGRYKTKAVEEIREIRWNRED